MEIIPAIDLKNGRCVRLVQGDFAKAAVYGADPVTQARRFADAEAKWLHVVDLDGARDGSSRQFHLIADVARQVPSKLQAGGGVHDASTIERLLDCGVARVVIGTVAAENPPLAMAWLKDYGSARIVLAFDVRLDGEGEPQVLTRGWQRESKIPLWELLKAYENSCLRTILCTDVARDGMMGGPNYALYFRLKTRWPHLDVLASGGVRDMTDILELREQGAVGVIVGKALYEDRIDLAAAVRQVRCAG
ncbi:MAG TPA: 1-(5-phosphoribosyl)-5-[(5-phosphoribosylamino)methylideneamino]imidazole-4-carboxamide isomerase [Rhizomicrobium sp.]|jgi:phosphoribosylformimino-5-aminoimidazole carboxamide ribotide isomerase|nr:1-(5-phosphoribosyl)-5-[(5-phosphoribosylamino)methylideneamino]imidazole-4-carboxamide isomerase [Rhizomicrobium sp.]